MKKQKYLSQGLRWLSCLLLLIPYTAAQAMLSEDTVETSEPPKVMLIEHNPSSGTLSLRPLTSMASVTQGLDARVMTFLASVSPHTLTVAGGIPSIASIRNGAATLKQQSDFLSGHTLEEKYPNICNTLTYLSRKQTALHKKKLQATSDTSDQPYESSAVNYAKDLTAFAVTEQWLDAIEAWLEDKIAGEASAVYPAKGKETDDYIEWIQSGNKKSTPEHNHLRLQQYVQVTFMSLMIQNICLVTDADQLDELLDQLYDNNWEATLYGLCDISGQWTFNKAMCQFADKNGYILRELVNCSLRNTKALKTFFISFPVTSAILAQAMCDETRDELQHYNPAHGRLPDSEQATYATYGSQIEAMDTKYPSLASILRSEIAKQFKLNEADIPVQCAAKQLMYMLRHRPAMLASFHCYPLKNDGTTQAMTERVMDYFEQAATDTIEDCQKRNIARAFFTLCDWTPFLELTRDICKQINEHQYSKQLLMTWLSDIPAAIPDSFSNSEKTFTKLYEHGVLLYAANKNIAGKSVEPWKAYLDSCFTEHFKMFRSGDLDPEHAFSYLASSTYKGFFSSVTDSKSLHSALGKVTSARYPGLSRTTWLNNK